MMAKSLRIIIFLAALLFVVIVLRTLKKKQISTKLSLVWIFASIVLMVAAVFSKSVIWISQVLGFKEAVNMVFFLAFLVLLMICLYLSMIVSKQQRTITMMIQEVSLLKKKVADETKKEEQ